MLQDSLSAARGKWACIACQYSAGALPRAPVEKDEHHAPASLCCRGSHKALNKWEGWLDAHKFNMLPPLTLSLATSPGFAGSSASSAAKFDADEIVKEHRLERYASRASMSSSTPRALVNA